MASLPLQRSMEHARHMGFEVWVVERFIPFPKPWGHRVDLFNLFDAIGIKRDVPGVLGIQACRDGDVAAHVTKIAKSDMPYLDIWKAGGNRAVIWGWSKKGPRGGAKRWTCREVVL